MKKINIQVQEGSFEITECRKQATLKPSKVQGEFKDKCDSVNCTSVRGFTET